ncbi:MAG: DUF748 domain-containing protein [Ginsengibacter sp.]
MKFFKGKFWKSRRARAWLIVILVLVILRLLLPVILLHYANKELANMDGYYGHIDDIDLSLYRGAYQINDMYLNKVDEKTTKQTDFFKTKNIDLSIQWEALFKGRLVGELVFDSPTLIFTANKTEISDVKKDTNNFRKILKDFMPLKVNRCEVNNGSIHYVDKSASPDIDISFQNTYALGTNLRNVEDKNVLLPSTITARATAYEGTATLNMKVNVLAVHSTFDLNAEVKNTNLVKLNDFLKAYGNFDVSKGTFSLYTEFAAKGGKYEGYLKPVIKDLDVLGPEDKKDGFFHKIYEGLIGTAGEILENHKEDQIATKIPIRGEFGKSQTNTLEAIWELLKNAFIRALVPAIDNKINIATVDQPTPKKRSFIGRILHGKDEKKNEKKDEKKK